MKHLIFWSILACRVALRMGAKRILFLAPLVIVMLCVMQHFAIAQLARQSVVNGECGAANGVSVSV
ncbi:MAG TPA: hypothetical protein VHT28_09490, partial [Silvibacterium sp.]|nr:hypothetical protein [Silvibacterium sp.]